MASAVFSGFGANASVGIPDGLTLQDQIKSPALAGGLLELKFQVAIWSTSCIVIDMIS